MSDQGATVLFNASTRGALNFIDLRSNSVCARTSSELAAFPNLFIWLDRCCKVSAVENVVSVERILCEENFSQLESRTDAFHQDGNIDPLPNETRPCLYRPSRLHALALP